MSLDRLFTLPVDSNIVIFVLKCFVKYVSKSRQLCMFDPQEIRRQQVTRFG